MRPFPFLEEALGACSLSLGQSSWLWHPGICHLTRTAFLPSERYIHISYSVSDRPSQGKTYLWLQFSPALSSDENIIVIKSV